MTVVIIVFFFLQEIVNKMSLEEGASGKRSPYCNVCEILRKIIIKQIIIS